MAYDIQPARARTVLSPTLSLLATAPDSVGVAVIRSKVHEAISHRSNVARTDYLSCIDVIAVVPIAGIWVMII